MTKEKDYIESVMEEFDEKYYSLGGKNSFIHSKDGVTISDIGCVKNFIEKAITQAQENSFTRGFQMGKDITKKNLLMEIVPEEIKMGQHNTQMDICYIGAHNACRKEVITNIKNL